MPKFRWYYVLFSLPLYLISLLPMPILLGLSDIIRFFVFHVFGYRKKVVFENLRNSYPDKSEEWIHKTAFAFYRNLFDVTLETIKIATASKQFFNRHVKVNDLELIQQLNQAKQPFILICGHTGNWEWAGQALHLNCAQVDVLYHPLSSKWFDWFMYHIRSKFGIFPIAMQSTLREMVKRKNIPAAITFISDQTPSAENCHWMQFLNQDTPVFLGAEKMAKKFNYPVVFGSIKRVKRGYYELFFKMLCPDPNQSPTFEITEMHTKSLELEINTYPELWLWSHRRWKHKRAN